MGEETGLGRARELLRRHQEESRQARSFTLLGREWELHPGVFSPDWTPVTELFTSWIPYPHGGSFLEMGSGAGVTAVWAALQGCREVLALDIARAAVDNTLANARRHGVTDRLKALRSDLFTVLAPGKVFDLVFWNSNFVETPAAADNETELHHAFFDPAYEAHRRYLEQAPAHLTPGGRLLLGFSSLGNHRHLRELVEDQGLEMSLLRKEVRQLPVTVEFQLLELRPARGRGWPEIAVDKHRLGAVTPTRLPPAAQRSADPSGGPHV
ncbi:methyltransferase [Kitasatospora kifunensis]|uniref:Release factor glutamine methyltransferase n=1 Tax=Kitasatospora kifunensis TaxID=58351 RepID=A0A7W7VTM5_KITKI|nr:methyltransferase [Kitasatospora kifunensis]MBB4922422.1 release factor glutamine methyltransferase [Kitasatospora kifunensis]